MSETKTKGTPRKRPYDVKRKLERAIARFKKQGKRLVWGCFGDIREANGKWEVPAAGCGCAISAYLDGKPVGDMFAPDFCKDAADSLGLTTGEVRDLWRGFDQPDYYQTDRPWQKLGAVLRIDHAPGEWRVISG